MAWIDRLRGELYAWRGTPYVIGSQEAHVGVDCRLFVLAVYDSLYGVTDPVPPALLDPDVFTDAGASIAAYRAMISRYDCTRIPALIDYVQPGDCVIFAGGTDTSRVGHVAIVGLRHGELWHAQPGVGVSQTSWGATRKLMLHAYRMNGKDGW
jgi:cell wall-associated NlpC family hydrolase